MTPPRHRRTEPVRTRATVAAIVVSTLALLPSVAQSLAGGPDAVPRTHTFPSRVLGRPLAFDVLAPPGFSNAPASASTTRYPVLYWLPDRGTSSNRFALSPQAVHDAIQQRILPPLFVVYVHEGAEVFYTDPASGRFPASTILVHELIPAVDRLLPSVPDRGHRAVQGIGRGGYGAFRLALERPEIFGSAASYSGVFPSTNAFATDPALRTVYAEVFGNDPARLATNHPVNLAKAMADRLRGRTGLRLGLGHGDPRLEENRAFRSLLRDARVDVDWREYPESRAGSEVLDAGQAVEGLEFAASWFAEARASDRGGPWVNPPGRPLPRLRHHLVYSELLDRPVGYSMYLPPGVSGTPEAPLPVVYHLHGRDENESSHLEATAYLGSALELREVPPFAWVWLGGGRGSWFMDSADGRVPAQSVLLDEVLPAIESRWKLGGSPERRAVDGWGMGAYGAVRYAALVPPVFGAALLHNPFLPDIASLPSRFPDAWSAVFNTNPRYFAETEPLRLLTRNADALRDSVRLRVVVGELAPVATDARRLGDHLRALHFPVEIETVPKMAGSGPELLRQTALRDLRFLGAAVTRPEP